ncbi:hypothetical protein G3I34_22985 [Streptomyces sp. SID8014]|uniref:hypothetical protein n=1 Tax=Streptomyces sp. SID8014 TaxID=2706097 RepID=UPI0013BA6D7C|nr:hypothetical protein [Streptomyces sp. SID8014]NEC15080.1 hypothetical protein [Streptomyces sp. SID8014]
MQYTAGQHVVVVSCEDDPRAVGRTGRIVDEVPPGPRTGGRWTVQGLGLLIGPVLCDGHELRPAGR